ncbi:ABC transporter substrate-binding protein [uncultured Brevundimonas sp.]|uniref:ABC transporter substrate-binding protein n=1 Tax=uncultured Brevundimonas sp. TaxID=213418 RepID=UPI0026358F40|nr:ABC transporter substrate-binding protein [uncultured Brevundimonas sp.]
MKYKLGYRLISSMVLAVGCGVPLAATAEPLRVMALDQCADQYVMALAPNAEVRLSPRADDPDSYFADRAKHYRMIRPTLEAAVAFRPDVVVRYWGGDQRLLQRLERDGVKIVNIDDATDFPKIAQNIRQISASLDAKDEGEALIADMNATLKRSQSAGRGREATYITASGFTAGSGTLIDSILTAAGFRNGTKKPGYQPIGLEAVVMSPPFMFVRGFFELMTADWRGVGRHPVLKPLLEEKTLADLPASTLSCPAWFAGDAVAALAESAAQ